MTAKYVQPGNKLKYSNTGSAISSGDVVLANNLFCVAEEDIAATTGVGTLATEGVFELSKETGVTFAVGEKLYWDAANSRLDKTSTNRFAGICWEGAASGATTCKIHISKAYYVSDDEQLEEFTSGASSGGNASEALTVTGLLSTDTVVSVSQKTAGANGLPLEGWSTVADDALTVSWGADPGAGAVVVVQVKR